MDMARYQLGLIQFTSGRIALALVTWRPLSQQSPDRPLQRIVQGFAALAADNPVAAEACLREGMALNHSNDALNRDLTMLLDHVATLRSTAPAPEPAAAEPATDEVDSGQQAPDEQGLHVLLANYQHHGPAH